MSTAPMNLLRTLPNPVLAARIEEVRLAKEADYMERMRKAKTNFDVLMVRGVICTVDDAEDNDRKYHMIHSIAYELGADFKLVEESMRLLDAETKEVYHLQSIVSEGESRAEYLDRVAAIMVTLPKGQQENADGEKTGRGCTHKGKQGWKFRGFPIKGGGSSCFCTACGMPFHLPDRDASAGPSPIAVKAAQSLDAAASWYEEQGETLLAALCRGTGEDNGRNWWVERNRVFNLGSVKLNAAEDARMEAWRAKTAAAKA